MKKTIRVLLILIFLIVGAYSAWQIYNILTEYKAGDELYTSTQQYVVVHPEPVTETEPVQTEPAAETQLPTEPVETGTEEPTEPTEPPEPKPEITFPEVDFEGLMAVSEDVIGWVYIEGTNINYPIVQGSDNRYYVSTMIDGTPNGAGSIFADFRNSSDFTDWHTVLYGHNMKNRSMFHDICNYRNQQYYDAHPMGLIITPEKNYYFEIVSGYVASLAEPAWQLGFVDENDAHQWLLGSMEKSLFTSSATPEPGDQMITLSTCSYEFSDARFVLVGILNEY